MGGGAQDVQWRRGWAKPEDVEEVESNVRKPCLGFWGCQGRGWI
jgi:hypothetical protein